MGRVISNREEGLFTISLKFLRVLTVQLGLLKLLSRDKLSLKSRFSKIILIDGKRKGILKLGRNIRKHY